jgi:catechol 2,3-dioxygenase-like lactoylglutathione lyase family enzyme
MGNQKIFQGIDTIIIRVKNLQAAKDWYVNRLQLDPVWEDEAAKLLVLETGGSCSLTIWETSAAGPVQKESTSYPIFRITNAEQARNTLMANGVECGEIIEDDSICFFQFQDTDGNPLEACAVKEGKV